MNHHKDWYPTFSNGFSRCSVPMKRIQATPVVIRENNGSQSVTNKVCN
uniref:Uncharacterized protein n=1 Tax=Schistosoma haematobium TaxID=6185 RepID=A0A095A465_SCHHA